MLGGAVVKLLPKKKRTAQHKVALGESCIEGWLILAELPDQTVLPLLVLGDEAVDDLEQLLGAGSRHANSGS